MEKQINHEPWKKILEKFSSYEGTVTSFCSENNVSKSQFYYHKRRADILKKPTFHAVSLNTLIAPDNAEKAYKDIRIEIGKANVFIPSNESELLKTILKELAATC